MQKTQRTLARLSQDYPFAGAHGPGVRVASGVYEGADIPPYYDSLFMLLMTAGPTGKMP